MAQEEKETIEYWKEKYAMTEIEIFTLKQQLRNLMKNYLVHISTMTTYL